LAQWLVPLCHKPGRICRNPLFAHFVMLSELLLTDIARLSQLGRLPLHRQLYESLRRAILDGRVGAGERLPSSRELSQDLALISYIEMTALSQLTVEGYLVSQMGSGTFVADQVPQRVTTMVLAAQGWA